MFDYVLLLAEGQTVFFGPAHQAVAHFSSMGIVPPPNVNPADFLLKAIHVPSKEQVEEQEVIQEHERLKQSLSISRSQELKRSQGIAEDGLELEDLEASAHVTGLRAATHEQVQKLIDGYKSSSYAAETNAHLGIDVDPADDDVGGGKKKKKKHKRTTADGQTSLAMKTPKGYEASYWKQLRLLFGRSWTNMLREPALLRARAFQAIAISLLAGLIWLRLKKTQAGAADRFSSIFFVMTSAVFGALNGPTFVFPSERGVFFREKSSNMYSTGLYYFSKYLVELPSNIIFPFISTTIVYWMIGFNDHPVPWLIMCGFAILLNIVGHAVGMLLTCAILDTGVVIKIQPLIILPLMIFSGFFVNADSVRNYFVWLEAISFLKYAFRGCCNAVFSLGKKLVFECPSGVCRYRDGADVLISLSLNKHPIWIDAVILLGMGIGIHIIAFIALYIHVKRM
jgi:hypothetical protein